VLIPLVLIPLVLIPLVLIPVALVLAAPIPLPPIAGALLGLGLLSASAGGEYRADARVAFAYWAAIRPVRCVHGGGSPRRGGEPIAIAIPACRLSRRRLMAIWPIGRSGVTGRSISGAAGRSSFTSAGLSSRSSSRSALAGR
jgi:hypothetical protein